MMHEDQIHMGPRRSRYRRAAAAGAARQILPRLVRPPQRSGNGRPDQRKKRFPSGKNSRGMLGTNGIAQMIVQSAAEQPDGSTPQTIMDEFVRRINDYADGMFRDDMCLLLARVSG